MALPPFDNLTTGGYNRDVLRPARGSHAGHLPEGHPYPVRDAEAFQEHIRTDGALRAFLTENAAGDGVLTRAPGRLDVMGGVADYSGALVAEATIAEAALVALQPRADDTLRLWSRNAAAEGMTEHVTVPLASLAEALKEDAQDGYEAAQAMLTADPPARWAAYLAGCWCVLRAEGVVPEMPRGANVVLDSRVPLGAGVSSSAAIEVATMLALTAALGLDIDGVTLARLAQTVENRVVGAPCGIMDQMTSALGLENSLLRILCRPHEVQGTQTWPAGARFFGINSHVKHSVGGGAYARARVAAFMGRRLLGVEYLASVTPAQFYNEHAHGVPETETGKDFLARYGETGDPVTRVDPDIVYPVRAATEHAINEHYRVGVFLGALAKGTNTHEIVDEIAVAGEMMYDSHGSYNRIGLGSDETDLLVRLAQRAGPEAGIYGAKITGGGSGGTVALLTYGDGGAQAVAAIAAQYEAQTGRIPQTFEAGLSPGALAFGVQPLIL